MKRSIIIVAVVVTAVLVPVALAKPTPYSSAQFYTPEALNAWGMRAQAEAQYYLTQGPSAGADDRIVSVGKPASSFYTQAALDAMGQRANAQANLYLTQGSGVGSDDRIVEGVRGTGPVQHVTPISDDGFSSWDKIGIGLVGALFALFLGVGLLLTVRRSKVAHA